MDEESGPPHLCVQLWDIFGIEALEIQLPNERVILPDLANMKNSAVAALIHFNRGNYIFPTERAVGTLAPHVTVADALGEERFLNFVAQKPCMPITKFDMSNETGNRSERCSGIGFGCSVSRAAKLKFPHLLCL